MPDEEVQLVQLRKKTCERIKEQAEEFGDTYDSILSRLLDKTEKKKISGGEKWEE